MRLKQKENTQRCHKVRQEYGFTQKVAFFYISLCFLLHCCANIGRDSCFLSYSFFSLILTFFFKQKTAYEISACLVGSEMCIRDRFKTFQCTCTETFSGVEYGNALQRVHDNKTKISIKYCVHAVLNPQYRKNEK